jgi:transposase
MRRSCGLPASRFREVGHFLLITRRFPLADAAQVDFGTGPTITDAHTGEIHKTWFFVMTLCWSRHQYVEFVRDQNADTWLLCKRAVKSY